MRSKSKHCYCCKLPVRYPIYRKLSKVLSKTQKEVPVCLRCDTGLSRDTKSQGKL